MQAAQLVGPAHFEVVEVPAPVPTDGEVLVAMRAASICGSDLHRVFPAANGEFPAAYPLAPGRPGHEGIGAVVESRSSRWRPGDLVLTVPMPGSGGCYATEQVVGEDFLVEIPEGTDPLQILMAQQLGTVVYGFHRYWPGSLDASGKRAAILGAGSAGLFALQLAKLAGFEQVLVSDLEPRRLEVASRLGADVVVPALEAEFASEVRAFTGGEGADLVIEAAGFDDCRAACVAAVRRFGRIGFFGLPEHSGLVPFPLAEAFRKACAIEMAGNAQLEPGLTSFREAVELIASGKVIVDDMVQARYELDQIDEAMDHAHERRSPKVSIDLQR